MKSILYDEAYAQRFRDRADTDLGRKIYACRWKLVEEYCHGPLRLLDYGCGPGAFHTASTNGFVTRGYDINPHCGYPSMPKGQFDIVTMWDVIEHLDSPVAVIRDLDPTWLFICTPNLHTADTISTWKHFRPGEHLYYFTPKSLQATLMGLGYNVLTYNYDEGKLRDPNNPYAIFTMVAKKRG